jgi:STAS-like domain of unknown function (DUF4325)
MSARVINVARDFSRYPAGRYHDDGPYSGAAFRDGVLIPALKAKELISVELDGVRGYGSSFLEEAFGGLVRSGFSVIEIRELITLKSSDLSLIEEIEEYIEHGNESSTND